MSTTENRGWPEVNDIKFSMENIFDFIENEIVILPIINEAHFLS